MKLALIVVSVLLIISIIDNYSVRRKLETTEKINIYFCEKPKKDSEIIKEVPLLANKEYSF